MHVSDVKRPDDIDRVFKALADPNRRRLLDLLRDDNGQSLGALCKRMAATRQAVTQHLAVLEAADLVVSYWHRREKLHFLNRFPIHKVAERWIRKFDATSPVVGGSQLARGPEQGPRHHRL